MGHDAVNHAGVDHDVEGAGADTGQIGCKIFLTQFQGADYSRSAVLARYGYAVTYVVLERYGYVPVVDMVGVQSLETHDGSLGHGGIYVCILTEILPAAGPQLVAAQVKCRAEGPWNIAGAGLVCGDSGGIKCGLTVKRGTHIDVLGEQGTAAGIGGTVVLVKSYQAGYSHYIQ